MKSNDDRYPDFKHEDDLINQRLTWLLQSQALLFAGYALILTSDKLLPVSARELARPFVIVGIVTASIILLGIVAATIAIHHIWWDSNKDDTGKPFPKGSADRKPLGVRWWTTQMGLSTALVLPLVFIFGWIYVVKYAPEVRTIRESMQLAPASAGTCTGEQTDARADWKGLDDERVGIPPG